MSMIFESYKQAELALAAYSNLYAGISDDDYTEALADDGKAKSSTQAQLFASTYTVVVQYNDPSGLFATAFAPKRVSAI